MPYNPIQRTMRMTMCQPTTRTSRRITFGALSTKSSTFGAPQHSQQRHYQNETFAWASQNRALAQACLEIPTTAPARKCPVPFESLEEYLQWRQWDIPAQDIQDGDDDGMGSKAKALISHVLSAPLTAASQLFSTFRLRHFKNKPMHWCCVGARAEASLPVEYWREILVLWAHYAPPEAPRLHLTIDFVGPDVLRRPPAQLSYQGHSLNMRWLYNGTFHELLHRMQDPLTVSDGMVMVDENTWDAYILFNPGIGHPNLRQDWEPTLKLLLSAHSTVGITGNTARLVFTAHSHRDAIRDTDCLTNYLLPEAPLYRDNPFASRIDYEDPFEAGHLVRPNHYVYTLLWQ